MRKRFTEMLDWKHLETMRKYSQFQTAEEENDAYETWRKHCQENPSAARSILSSIVCLAQHAQHTFGRWSLEQPRAFHNQRPQAIAVTGFLQPRGRRSFPTQAFHAATCHVQGSDRIPAGETAVDRFLDTGVGLKASAKKDQVSLPHTSR